MILATCTLAVYKFSEIMLLPNKGHKRWINMHHFPRSPHSTDADNMLTVCTKLQLPNNKNCCYSITFKGNNIAHSTHSCMHTNSCTQYYCEHTCSHCYYETTAITCTTCPVTSSTLVSSSVILLS